MSSRNKATRLFAAMPILFTTVSLFAAPPRTLDEHCQVFPSARLFDACIDALMDKGYVIRSSDMASGVISFDMVFQAGSYSSKHVVNVEGSLVIRPLHEGKSKIRLLIHQTWEDSASGKFSGSGVETDTDMNYYQTVFQAIQASIPH